MKKPSYAELERQIRELNAQKPNALRNAVNELHLCGGNKMLGSAVLITITAWGGEEIVEPFAVYDGLSQSTIDALRADIRRTMERVCKP